MSKNSMNNSQNKSAMDCGKMSNSSMNNGSMNNSSMNNGSQYKNGMNANQCKNGMDNSYAGSDDCGCGSSK